MPRQSTQCMFIYIYHLWMLRYTYILERCIRYTCNWNERNKSQNWKKTNDKKKTTINQLWMGQQNSTISCTIYSVNSTIRFSEHTISIMIYGEIRQGETTRLSVATDCESAWHFNIDRTVFVCAASYSIDSISDCITVDWSSHNYIAYDHAYKWRTE